MIGDIIWLVLCVVAGVIATVARLWTFGENNCQKELKDCFFWGWITGVAVWQVIETARLLLRK